MKISRNNGGIRMKKIICFLLAAVIAIVPMSAFAETYDIEELLSDVSVSLTPVTDSETIEVGDQFLVSFELSEVQPFLSFQVQGTFDASKAQIVAPVYGGVTVIQNDFDNENGTFSLVAADLTISGVEDTTVCSILFEATAEGEFSVNIDGDGIETMVGRKEADENGGLFYLLKLNNATFEITGDTDGEKVYVIKEPDPITPFDDMFGYDWAERSVGVMYKLGALENIAENSYFPGKNITRGEFVTMLVKVCNLTASQIDSEAFGDIDENSYNYEPIMIAKSLKIVFGDEENDFRPDEEISRQDICAILFRTMLKMKKVNEMDDAQKYIGSFSDKDSIAEYALDSVAAMIRAKIIIGDDSNLLRPTDNMTRAEAAVVLNRVAEFNKLISL
jgi:hypothetical protein